MGENINVESGISISELFRYLWKNIILFSIVALCVFTIGSVYSFAVIKPEYKSSSTVVVAVKAGEQNSSQTEIDYSNSLQLIETVAYLIQEDIVIDPVAEEYSLNKTDLKKMITVSSSSKNFLVTVSVENHDKNLSKRLTNSIVDQLISVTENVEGLAFLKGAITQTSFAKQGEYSSPNKLMCLVLSFAAGLVLGAVAVLIKEVSFTKFRSRKEIESLLSCRVIGYFPDDKNNKLKKGKNAEQTVVKARLVPRDLKNYEPYNALLGNIRYSNLENPVRAIMFTSSRENELKSTTVCNLAACIVYNRQSAVIIDLDMRRPVVHKVFGVSGDNGLVEYFEGECKREQIIKRSAYGVDVITAGKKIINPMAVIGHKQLPVLINQLKKEYDYVLVDAPPVLACADAVEIGRICDGVIFNVAMLEVHKKESQEAVSALRTSGSNVIGVNVTKGTEGKSGGAYYGKYGYYTENTIDKTATAEAAATDPSDVG